MRFALGFLFVAAWAAVLVWPHEHCKMQWCCHEYMLQYVLTPQQIRETYEAGMLFPDLPADCTTAHATTTCRWCWRGGSCNRERGKK